MQNLREWPLDGLLPEVFLLDGVITEIAVFSTVIFMIFQLLDALTGKSASNFADMA